MSFHLCIMFLLMIPCWVIAESTVHEDIVVLNKMVLIIAIIFIFAVIAIGFLLITYFTLKFIKKQMSEPQYYIDEIVSNKDSNEYHDANQHTHSTVQVLHQIQPILTVAQVFSSVKQSLTGLTLSLIPSNWLYTRRTTCYQQNSSNQPVDLSI